MAIVSFPYTSTDGDRKITAQNEAKGFEMLSKNGITPDFLNCFEVTTVSGALQSVIDTGGAILNGHRVISDASITLTHAAAEALPRIDTIIIESSTNTPVRAGRIYILKGTAASAPVAPTLTNNDQVQQTPICDWLIPANATTLESATMTDRRTYVCGRHKHKIQDIDEMMNIIYPVGSIYMSANNNNPSSLFGGTWISWGNGKVPVGVDSNDPDFNAAEKSGGSKKLQSHSHTFTGSTVTSSANSASHVHEIPQLTGTAVSAGAHTHPTQQGDHYVMSSNSTINDEAGGKIAETGYVYPAAPAGTDFTTDNGTGSAGAHTHNVTTRISQTGGNSNNHTHTVAVTGTIKSTGEGTSQNLQPYITCYMWKRTA